MKKTEKKVTKKVVAAQKAVLVKPNVAYTCDEARGFLGLSKGSSLVPSKYGMRVHEGKVSGRDVIAYLESGSCRKAKVGRRYASGTVTVVAR